MHTEKRENLALKPQVINACPNCGRALSAWEQVLLNVDRALVCKGCWYRILLNPFDEQSVPREPKKPA